MFKSVGYNLLGRVNTNQVKRNWTLFNQNCINHAPRFLYFQTKENKEKTLTYTQIGAGKEPQIGHELFVKSPWPVLRGWL